MGLMKFLARKGAIGGTARVIAKQYKHYRSLHPDKGETEDSVIYRLIISNRFRLMKNKEHEAILMENARSINGLKELVVEILTLEAGFAENTYENQIMFEDIIEEELLKKGISKEDI